MIELYGVLTTVICDRKQWPDGSEFACARGMIILTGQHTLDSPYADQTDELDAYDMMLVIRPLD